MNSKRNTTYIVANWIALPPTPAKPSMTTPPPQRRACLQAIFSGVTENHPSSSILIPWSYLKKRSYLWTQYFFTSGLTPSSLTTTSLLILHFPLNLTDEKTKILKKLHNGFKIRTIRAMIVDFYLPNGLPLFLINLGFRFPSIFSASTKPYTDWKSGNRKFSKRNENFGKLFQ